MILRFLTFIILGSLLFWAGSCGLQQVKPDAGLSAAEAGDYTALIEGCGNQLVPGYTYCRKVEGESAEEVLYFIVPKTDCVDDGPCASFKIFFPDSTPSYGASVPRGMTRVSVPWSLLLNRDHFEIKDRGFWQYIYDIKWLDPEGKEHVTRSIGEIRMRVLPKEYVALDQISNDPNFAWEWVELGTTVRMTTGARTYVEKKK